MILPQVLAKHHLIPRPTPQPDPFHPLYSLSVLPPYCHTFSKCPCTGHLVATPPCSPLHVSQPQQQLGSTCSWSALLLCLAVSRCCNWVTWGQGPASLNRVSCVSDRDVTQALLIFSKLSFNRKIKLPLLRTLYRNSLISLWDVHSSWSVSEAKLQQDMCWDDGLQVTLLLFHKLVTIVKIGKHLRNNNMMILNSRKRVNYFTIK